MVRSARWTLLLALALIGLPGAVSAQQTHKVVTGETLWGLSQRYYSDPYKWPQIYEANRAGIKDPHWIYPGQDLTIPNVAAAVTTVAVEPARPAQPTPPPPPPAPEQDPERTVFYQPGSTSGFGLSAALDQQRLAVPRDLAYAAPWVVPLGAPTGSIGHLVEFSGAEDEQIVRTTAMEFDRLEVAFNGVTPARGTELLSFRVDHTIPGLGDVLIPTGVVAVSDPVPGGAVVLVVDVFNRLEMGDLLIPVPTYTLQPGARAVPTNTGADATIVGFALPHVLQDVHDVAFLDQGSDNGVKVGDEYVLTWVEGTGTPPVEEGRLQVISVHRDHASAQIIEMRNAIFNTGVRVRLDRRMP